MRRRRLLALVAGAAALVLTPVMAGAVPLTSENIYKPQGFFRFCSEAQVEIANIDEAAMATAGISIGGYIYEDYETDFQYSKSAVDIDTNRIITATWIQYADTAKTQPRTIRCKMRTGESLNEGAWPPGAGNNGGRFAVDPYFGFGPLADDVSTTDIDQDCTVINQNTINAVWAGLSPAQQAASPYKPTDSTLVTAPDIPNGTGPEWLQDTPPLSVSGGVLTLQARSLIAETAYDVTARLTGAHYCTLAPPTYLRDVLLGARTVS